jgi:hypothetical protein
MSEQTHDERVQDMKDQQGTDEETEMTVGQPPGTEGDEVNGIEGQIIYPDPEVDAERAARFAAGKEDSLYDDENEAGKSRTGWQNPADRPTEVRDEETEPEAKDDDSDQPKKGKLP